MSTWGVVVDVFVVVVVPNALVAKNALLMSTWGVVVGVFVVVVVVAVVVVPNALVARKTLLMSTWRPFVFVVVVVAAAAAGCGGGAGACWRGYCKMKKEAGGGLGGRAQRPAPNALTRCTVK